MKKYLFTLLAAFCFISFNFDIAAQGKVEINKTSKSQPKHNENPPNNDETLPEIERLPNRSVSPVENKSIFKNRPGSSSTSTVDPNKIYYAVEVQSDFPGGDKARIQWMRENMNWPRDNNGKIQHGTVDIDFIIERDGAISNVTVKESDNPLLNNAAIELISSMPNWIPAQVNKHPVRSTMGMTLFF